MSNQSRKHRGYATQRIVAEYLQEQGWKHALPVGAGRDGNITALVNAAAKFQQIRESFKGAYKDLAEEQQSQVRGNIGLAYDQ